MSNARIPCSEDTRNLVRSLKRGGESYDDLLRVLVDESDRQPAE